MIVNPLEKLAEWLAEEKSLGNNFAHGAVLGTTSVDKMPHTRMLGVYFSGQGIPKFYTSPGSRKVKDINLNQKASLTFAFQYTMRSISLEGYLKPLNDCELDADWQNLDLDFQKNYLVFGHQSGKELDSLQTLRNQQEKLPILAENTCPSSFIGYFFNKINRIKFYTVAQRDFALSELYELDRDKQNWIYSLRVP